MHNKWSELVSDMCAAIVIRLALGTIIWLAWPYVVVPVFEPGVVVKQIPWVAAVLLPCIVGMFVRLGLDQKIKVDMKVKGR